MHTKSQRQNLAFGIIMIGIAALVALGGAMAVDRDGVRPTLVELASAPQAIGAPPSVGIGSAPASPPVRTLQATAPTTTATASDRAAAEAAILRAEPQARVEPGADESATAVVAAPTPTAAPEVVLEAPQTAAVAPEPVAERAKDADDVEVASLDTAPETEELAVTGAAKDDDLADTSHSDDTLSITVSRLPDSPDVAASHGTELVEVDRTDDPWEAVRQCESTGRYDINTGNGFYGAYQFTRSTWNWVAEKIGRDDLVGVRPDRATPTAQDAVANALAFEVAGGGLRHWPVCGRQYGR